MSANVPASSTGRTIKVAADDRRRRRDDEQHPDARAVVRSVTASTSFRARSAGEASSPAHTGRSSTGTTGNGQAHGSDLSVAVGWLESGEKDDTRTCRWLALTSSFPQARGQG